MSADQYRVGVDIGGTFTDFVLHTGDALFIAGDVAGREGEQGFAGSEVAREVRGHGGAHVTDREPDQHARESTLLGPGKAFDDVRSTSGDWRRLYSFRSRRPAMFLTTSLLEPGGTGMLPAPSPPSMAPVRIASSTS